jgi:sodium-dependent dicarboxylate transporter 2/3/5
MSNGPDYPHLGTRIGRWLGPLLAILWFATAGAGMPHDARVVLALAIWMAVWWMTEAVPLSVTALLPLVVLPPFSGLAFGTVASPYASSIVFLFMGGFMLGLALQHSGLHRRIALSVLVLVGSGQRQLVGGFMLVTALLSMWMSNTATAMIVMPIGLSVIQACYDPRASEGGDTQPASGFAAAIVLGIAYAASIGGMGTPIGTPPNLIMSGYLREHYGMDVSMLEWMRVAIPVLLLLLPATWAWLCFVSFRLSGSAASSTSRDVLRARLAELGPVTPAEGRVGAIFALVAVCWVLRPQIVAWTGLKGLDDAVIALMGALLLFLVPSGRQRHERLLDWHTAQHLPWDILLLFGGGLSLAAAISASGADAPLTAMLSGFETVPVVVIILLLAVLVVFSGELTSNTAAATALMPVLGALCAARGLDVLPVFMVATLAGSCGFMLPVATPPNAIAFGTGFVPMRQMMRAGLAVNLIGIAVIVGYVWLVAF